MIAGQMRPYDAFTEEFPDEEAGNLGAQICMWRWIIIASCSAVKPIRMLFASPPWKTEDIIPKC